MPQSSRFASSSPCEDASSFSAPPTNTQIGRAVQQDSTYLDGQYACFGYVTKGMDVVDEICDNTPVEDDNGTVKTENQPVIESIKIID